MTTNRGQKFHFHFMSLLVVREINFYMIRSGLLNTYPVLILQVCLPTKTN